MTEGWGPIHCFIYVAILKETDFECDLKMD